MRKTIKKLSLKAESIRVLSSQALAGIVGGISYRLTDCYVEVSKDCTAGAGCLTDNGCGPKAVSAIQTCPQSYPDGCLVPITPAK